MNIPIGESISKCKEDIRTILYRLKAFYEPCDLDTARGFTDNFINGLNKVFDDFLNEAFIHQSDKHNDTEKEATISSSIPIVVKQESHSNEIYIVESDDDTFQIKDEPISFNETPTQMDIEMQYEYSHSNSMNKSNGNSVDGVAVENESSSNYSNVVAATNNKRKWHQWSTRNKIPTTCDLCKAEFKTSISLISHRRIHLDQFDFHCRICLLGFFQKYDRNCHESKCKNRRYECYICRFLSQSSNVIEKHFRTHTEMTSYVFSKAYQRRSFKRNAKAQKIGKKYVATKKAIIKMETIETMEKTLTPMINFIDLTDDDGIMVAS